MSSHENGPNAVYGGSFSPNTVSPRFEAAAARMPAPRLAGWAASQPPRLFERRPLEVEAGFLVSDIKTIEDCDVARSILSEAILSIEGQIDGAVTRDRNGGPKLDLEWQRKARGALRAKKMALDEVEVIRARVKHENRASAAKSAERALLDVVRELDPVLLSNAETVARQRGWIA